MSFESPNEIPQWFADRRAECRLESVECRRGRRVAGVGHGKPSGASIICAARRLRRCPVARATENGGGACQVGCQIGGTMRYLLGIIIPPLGMLSVGKPVQAVICLILMFTVIGWIPASIWALLTINSAFADGRSKKLIDEQRKQTDRIVEASRKP